MIDQAQVSAEALQSRRYRYLAVGLVQRVAASEARGARNHADAVKRTKRRLHQITGAFAGEIDSARALALLRVAFDHGDEAVRRACASVMAQHASTAERLPHIDRFYSDVFRVTGTPGAMLDVACGLGPLALPWMDLPKSARYVACDVDQRLVDVAAGFLSLWGQTHQAGVCDIASTVPGGPFDVALVLKTLPCLEQQAPGGARTLLERLDATWLVVSYPTRSLGGVGGKGMAANYRRQFDVLVGAAAQEVVELVYPGELVFVVRR